MQVFTVNGGDPINVVFEGEKNIWRQEVVQVPLLEGDNTIVLTPSWGWMYFDYIAFSFIEPPGILAGKVVDCDLILRYIDPRM